MPNKKKQPKNAFFYFMLDVRVELGLARCKMNEIADIAGEKWKNLSYEEKQVYEDMAKAEKERQRNCGEKLDSYGESVQETRRQEDEERQSDERMGMWIRDHLHYLNSMESVVAEPIYFLSTNAFCETIEGHHVPAEVGLVKYSIKEGIMTEFHCFVHPGEIPTGYAFSCQETSNLTHRIPYREFDLARDDYALILDRISDVIYPDGETNNIPPFYCSYKERSQTSYILEWMQIQAERRHEVGRYTVYDSSYLFYSLMEYLGKMRTLGVARDKLDSTAFSYNKNACCKWHSENDCGQFCALGAAKRACYIFSDHFCSAFDITPKPNYHLPETESADGGDRQPPEYAESISRVTSSSRMSSQSSISTVSENVRSVFCPKEEKHYVPSASSEVASRSHDSKRSQNIGPPRHTSYVGAASAASSVQSPFSLDEKDFPVLDVSSNYPSSVSGSTISGRHSPTSSVSSMTSASAVKTESNSNALWRGIGRGRGFGRGKPPTH